MFKNKAALKLSLYFGITLIVFSIVIGSSFMFLFKKQTIDIHKKELENRAESISNTLSDYFQNNSKGGYGAYIRFLSEIAGADAWVVDENLNLITGSAKGYGNNNNVNFNDLPPNANKIVQEVFDNKTVFSEDFSGLLSEPTLTVGVPIKNNSEKIIGVVLLHTPINGTNQAIQNGMGILALSILIGLLLSLALSFWLSKNYTDPIISKEAADALKMEKIRRDFVANISHELNTPITVIRGSLEALNDKVISDPDQIEEYHQQMLKESISLQRLVGDLLDLSKLQNADFIIEKSQVNIYELIDDVVRSANQLAKEKQIKIEIQKEADFIFNGDYGRLRQMLLITLNNAIKFSENNDVVIVTITKNQIEIKDNGIGISKEELPFIFDRFKKAQTNANESGSGLGLAIAKQIADRHNIEINVQSIESKGTTFVFKFK